MSKSPDNDATNMIAQAFGSDFVCVSSVANISGLPQKSLTVHICGKSTTCVENGGKRCEKAVSKWEKLHHFPAFCPLKVEIAHLPDHLFPPLPAFTRQGRRTAPTSALCLAEIVSRGSCGSRLTLPLCSLRSIVANLCSLRFMVFSISVFNSCFIRG